MSRVFGVLAVCAALVAACGGSGPKTSSSAATAGHSGTRATVQTAATPTSTAPSGTTVTTGATDVRLPATFTISPGGTLAPPTVSAPASVAVELTLISHDAQAHRVAVASRTLTVPARGHASALLTGLKRGRHAIDVDGRARGALVVGAQPGP
jgi:hypothetical protein